MSGLVLQIFAGLVVAGVSGGIGYLIRRQVSGSAILLPPRARPGPASYKHLSGDWNLYFLSRHPAVSDKPIWLHAIQHLEVKGRRIETSTMMDDHPSSRLVYRGRGEIRQGRMIIADDSLQDETEFASIIYCDLLKADLVGIWTGFDGQSHLIAAPAVLSRRELKKDDLTTLTRAVPMTLLSPSVETAYYMKGAAV